ncbi:hypothetical protein IAT38_007906 [Cryptococcus sp. DSM 104549]
MDTRIPPNRKPKILFLTKSGYGEANCHLAVIAALLEHHEEEVDIHLVSFEPLRERAPSGVQFHAVSGRSLLGSLQAKTGSSKAAKEILFNSITHSPGLLGSKASSSAFLSVHYPETPRQYLRECKSVEKLVLELSPELVVAGDLYAVGRDVLKNLGWRHVRLSSRGAKDVLQGEWRVGGLKWPAMGSGHPYPLPWYLYPYNTLCMLYPLVCSLTDPQARALNSTRRSAGYHGNSPVFISSHRLTPVLCMSALGADTHGDIPPSIVCCGPIIHASEPLHKADPDLLDWVMQRPIVLISLGTLFLWKEDDARHMLVAIRVFLEKRTDVQVLWKLAPFGKYELEGTEEVGGRLRIVEWLVADPMAILETGNVVCFVNHGGSNSYHEGLGSGTPQIILPAWSDCYDFATKAEYLGHGVWGNKSSAPKLTTSELVQSFLAVVGNTIDSPQAVKIRNRARELRRIVTSYGRTEGKLVAAEKIREELDDALREKRLGRSKRAASEELVRFVNLPGLFGAYLSR